MKLFFKSYRNNQAQYTAYEGVKEENAKSLMAEIGHSNIETITEKEFEKQGEQSGRPE